IILIDNNGILMDANQASLNIFGVTKNDDLVGFKIFEDLNIPEVIKQKIKTGKSVRIESKFCYDKVTECNGHKTKNVQTNYLDSSITPLKLSRGTSDGFLVQVQDITKKKCAELALKNSENQLRSITTNMRDIILQVNLDGVIEYISPSCKNVLGYEPETMLGKNLTDYMDPEDYNLVKQDCCSKVIFDHRHVNGEYVCLEAIGSPLRDDNDNKIGVVFSMRDVTERKRIEKEMARLDRLRLSGEIAASIGHEIRNPLTTVQGFLQMLRKEPALTEFQSYFDLMSDELNATNTIITEFLSLAQDKPIFLRTQNLNTLVNKFCPLITAEAIKSEKSLVWEPGNIKEVSIDGNEIRQLILNLTLNGLEAMEPGGNLEIKTYMDEDKVVLSIKDQGSGISSEIIDKLGTPFVTTKENGTGLGLAICYSIAARHRATIDLKTGPEGTSFQIRFNSIQD
ncbi:MAG: PAS domain S-box protein, partial [Syntrophomonas sp.]